MYFINSIKVFHFKKKNNYLNFKTRNDEGIDDDCLYEISFKYDSIN